jgi:uncharacterized protein RhaS with RHS repeats
MLSPLERRKDAIQMAVESAFSHVGQIATIVADAGRDVTREIGDWATDMFEIRDAARRAELDDERAAEAADDPAGELPGHEADGHTLRRPLRRR